MAGIEDSPRELEGLNLYRMDSCFELLTGATVIEGYLKEGAYLLTPGWLARWRHYVDAWGFDRETAREFFGESATRLLLLDTGVDAGSPERLREFADYVGLPFEIVPVGLDFFRLWLARAVLGWRLEGERRESTETLEHEKRRSANYAMVLDLIGSLSSTRTESEVIENIFELFAMFCAPARLVYLPFNGGRPGDIQLHPESLAASEETKRRLSRFQEDHAWTDSGDGFLLKIHHRNETVGILEVDGISFPEYREHYLNLALTFVQVCGLAIADARIHQKLERSIEQLQEALAQRSRAEEALRQSQEWLEVTLSSIGDGVIATDTTGAVIFMNPVAEELTGWTAQEALGQEAKKVFRIVNGQSRQAVESPVERVLKEGLAVSLGNHTVLIAQNGREVPILDNGAPIRTVDGTLSGVVLVFHDNTEGKRMERELVHLERLRAVGELSAGVSHNLNNILTGVLGPAQLLKRKTDDPGFLREVDDIITSAARARDLVHQLHLSVRTSQEEFLHPVPLDLVIQQAVQTSRPRWKDEPEARSVSINVVTHWGDVPSIQGTKDGLQDILINLIFNAVDALPEGGTIAIRTETVGDQVQITFSDTGIGMDEETRRRVFEPFFTTKMDIGSGLGLSTAYNTVAHWGGSIEVESAPGQGTCFVIRLPVWTGAEVQEEEPRVVRPVRRGKVLIVEDDEGVCRLLLSLLSQGHEVEAVPNGRQAFERFAPGGYDVALIDLGIPGMPGDQVARELREADRSVATVLITGWELKEGDLRLSAFDFRLLKPFDDLDRVEDVVAQAIELHDGRAGEKG